MAERAKEAELRAALDAHVHEAFGLACAVIAALQGFFALADLFITPAPHAFRIALLDALVAAVFLAGHVAFRRRSFAPARAHAASGALALLLAADQLHDTYLLRDPQQTAYLMLLVVGAGSIFLHHRWLYAVVAAAFAGWCAVAALRADTDWTTYGLALFAACVLAVLVHAVRYRTIERLETLRQAEHARKEQLELREKALEAAVEALQESEERYRRLVESAPDAMLVIADERILYANPAAARLFGAATPAELHGMIAARLVHPDFAALVRERTRNVGAGGSTDFTEIVCLRLDGTPVDVEVIGRPITFLGRRADQTVIRDISDRKRAEAERHVASQRLAEISRLKEMDRVKTQFVNTVSHELRTPLTPIKVQLRILKDAQDPARTQKATEVIERNVARLSGLVDELLEVARIQAGTLSLAKTFIDVGAAVQQAIESYVDVARQQEVDLQVRIDPDLPAVADPKRLQQVMYNLLGNAFKFTRKGGRVVVAARREGGEVVVSVADDGAGMDPASIPRLFEPFSQVHDPMERTNAGTGLGLYICRGIVEGHGGRIWAESEGPGKGSRFVFALPLAPPG